MNECGNMLNVLIWSRKKKKKPRPSHAFLKFPSLLPQVLNGGSISSGLTPENGESHPPGPEQAEGGGVGSVLSGEQLLCVAFSPVQADARPPRSTCPDRWSL